MACMRCSSERQKEFTAEMNLLFPGYEGLDKPTVWVFPRVVVCEDCGFAEFVVAVSELRRLRQGEAMAP